MIFKWNIYILPAILIFLNQLSFAGFPSGCYPPDYDSLAGSFKNGVAVAVKKKGYSRFGLVSKSGKWIIPSEYDSMSRVFQNLVLADSSGLCVLFDIKGKRLAFGNLPVVSGDSILTLQNEGKIFVYNSDGRLKFDRGAKSYSHGKAFFYKKWALRDTAFNILQYFEGDSVRSEGDLVKAYLNGKEKVIYPFLSGAYDEIRPFKWSYFAFRNAGRWGLINKESNIVLKPDYDSLSCFHSYIRVGINGKFGLLDSVFKPLLPISYLKLEAAYPEGSVLLKEEEREGLYKKGLYVFSDFIKIRSIADTFYTGCRKDTFFILGGQLKPLKGIPVTAASLVSDSVLVACDSACIYYYHVGRREWFSDLSEKTLRFLHDTLLLVRRDTMLGVKHFPSDSVYLFEADTAWPHPVLKTRLLTKKHQFLGLASREGYLLTNYNRRLTWIGPVEGGYMEVISRRKYGILDTNGYLILATQYDSVKPLRNGFAAIKLRGKWGYVNRKEEIIVQPNYTKSTFFKGLTGPVWTGSLATLADRNNKELFKPRFTNITPTSGNYWITYRNKLYGFFDTSGNEIYNLQFSSVSESPSGYFIVIQYGRTAVFNTKLQVVIPFQNKQILSLDIPGLFVTSEE